MRTVLVLSVLGFISVLSASEVSFEEFKMRLGRTYASPEAESVARKAFERNTQKIKALMHENPNAKFSALSSMADVDFSARRIPLLLSDNAHPETKVEDGSTLPTSVNWISRGAVTPVGNMGMCGDSAAWAITDIAEGATFIANGGTLIPLAHSQIRECYTGCDGADAKTIVNKVIANGGALYTNASWVGDDCRGTLGSQVGTYLTSYVPIPKTSQGLARAVALQGPTGVAVYAADWATYTGGVMGACGNSSRTDPPDTYATVVGYDDNAPTPYWIIKNNWGTDWGENGYIYIARYSDQCLVHSEPFSVTVKPTSN